MFPNLYSSFNAVDAYDPRNQLHVVYPMAMILLIVFLKNALSYISMRIFSIPCIFGVTSRLCHPALYLNQKPQFI